MKKSCGKGLLFVVAIFAIAGLSFGDLAGDIQKLVGDNAINYVHPLTNSLGIGMNSGWNNSSKSYSFLKIPVGLQAYYGMPLSVVSDDLRKYDFKGAVAIDNVATSPAMATALKTAVGKDSLNILKADAPTAVGSKNRDGYTFKQLLVQNGVDSTSAAMAPIWTTVPNDTVLYVPGGLGEDINLLPSVPAIGINLGLPFKVQLGLRIMPTVNVPTMGEISQFGFKLQYEFTQWIPVVSALPLLHTSAFYAYNGANIFDIMKLSNWTTMLNVSTDFKFLVGLGLYGGIGFEGSTMELDYTIPDDVPGLGGTKVSLEDEGDNFFKANAGLRFSFACFDIMADATFAKTNAYFFGFGIGLNGL